jgi:SP family sugar:H+ symporter-like MFS transporter
MAVGAASVLSPAYISEVAPANIRGRMTTVQQVMIITGLTAAFVVNYYLAGRRRFDQQVLGRDRSLALDVPDAGTAGRCIPDRLVLHSGEPALSGLQGPQSRCASCAHHLFGPTAGGSSSPRSRRASRHDHRPRLSDVLTPPAAAVSSASARSCGSGIMLAVFQQLVGINVIFYYGATLWQAAGFSERTRC